MRILTLLLIAAPLVPFAPLRADAQDYRAAVKKEFDGIKALFGEYQDALRKGYVVPKVADPPPAQHLLPTGRT